MSLCDAEGTKAELVMFDCLPLWTDPYGLPLFNPYLSRRRIDPFLVGSLTVILVGFGLLSAQSLLELFKTS